MLTTSLRRQKIALAIATLLAAIATLASSTARATVLEDADQDGIDDGLEAELAARFLPELRYHEDENPFCRYPLSHPTLFRVRHPYFQGQVYTNWIAINYVRLYSSDCGPLVSLIRFRGQVNYVG